MSDPPHVVAIAFFTLAAVGSRSDAAECTGAGGPDKIELPAGYSKANLPSKPEDVILTFQITDITDIDAMSNQLHMTGYITLLWNDTRVKVTGERESDGTVILDKSCLGAVWTPDIWIERLVEFTQQKVTGDLARLIISKEHEFNYWQSVNMKIACPMQLNLYPMDNQTCLIRFSANGLEVNLQKFSGEIYLAEGVMYSKGALQYKIELEKYPDLAYHTSTCKDNEKCWPQIAADLRLRRNFLNHAIQTFMPTGCLVLLSWISFLIPPYIVPGRMVLLVTLLLVVFGTYSDAHQRAPGSSGVKVQDIWFISCICFILLAITEYAACLYLKRNLTRKKRKAKMKLVKELVAKASKEDGGDQLKKKEEQKLFVVRTFADNVLQKRNHRETGSRGCSPLLRGQQDPPPTPRAPPHENPPPLLPFNPFQNVGKTAGGGTIDTGAEYGDINDTNMEGEETLENIDYISLKIFPCMFLLFMVIFWATFMSGQIRY